MRTRLTAQCLLALLLCIPAFYSTTSAQSNFIVSENWVNESPSGSVFRKISVQTDLDGNVYVAGHLLNGGGNNDIIVQKYDDGGGLLWERTYDGPGAGDDFSAALFIDGDGNVYVTGAVTVSPTVGFSIVVLKYDDMGIPAWEYVYDNGIIFSPLAGGTDIRVVDGYVYVIGSCFGSVTSADFVALKLDMSDGSEVWTNTVDNAGLRDFPIRLTFKAGTTFGVSGVTEVLPNAFMYAGNSYNKATGTNSGIDVQGDTVPGINDIFDMTTDGDGNTYIVGTTYSAITGYDWLVLKLDNSATPNLVLRFTETSAGMAEDRALAIQFDGDGNIYVAGYFTVAGEGKNIGVAKYDNLGAQQWIRTYNGTSSTDDAALRMSVDGDGRVFVAGYVHNGTYSDYITLGYAADGKTLFQIEYDSPYGLDDMPTDMIMEDGSLTVVGNSKDAMGNFKPSFVNYLVKERPLNIALDGDDVPVFLQNEIIVRFRPEVVNTDFVNDKRKTIINLADLVSGDVIDAMSAKANFSFDDDGRGDIWVSKIFIGLDTTDTISTSRSGNIVKVDPLWSAFVIHLEAEDTTLAGVTDSLNFLPDIIQYAHLNYIATPLAYPDDSYYSEQGGFKNNADNPGGVGIEGAWDIEKGRNNVSIGIFDFEMDWSHEDFGDGTYNGSIVRGWDFCHSMPISQITTPESFHGTHVGGLVGALKNNNKGVAGIAGKDPAVSGSGAVINSYKVLQNGGMGFAAVSDLAYAIHWGANYTGGYGAGLHIQNHSWQVKPNITYAGHTLTQQELGLLKDAVRSSWINECAFVVGRGNDDAALTNYPACYPDSWVISVGASGIDGQRKFVGTQAVNNGLPLTFGSSYGQNMDLLAPGVTSLIYTTSPVGQSYEDGLCLNNTSGYSCSAGSSLSAPHVTGAAALILSQQNTAFPHDPGNLTGEDVEHLMELTADLTKGSDTTTYDAVSGWGLLRMDSLMPLIKAPEYRVIHFSGDIPDQKHITLESSNVTISFQEQYATFPAGYYVADKYHVVLSFSEDISPAEYLGSWPRMARADGLDGTGLIFNDSYSDFGSINIGASTVATTFQYYFYFIKHPQGSATTINTWIPHDTVKTYTPYSVWVYDESFFGTSIQEQEGLGEMTVFPVPSSDIVTVSFSGGKANKVRLELISVDGKVVLAEPVILNSGKGQVQIDVSNLSRGIYFLKADYGTYVKTKKVVVQ